MEAAFFHLGIPGPELTRIFLFEFLLAALLALAVGRLVAPAPGVEPARSERSAWSWASRIAASDLAYLVAYFTAGMAIFPYVRAFYAARALPSPLAVLGMQLGRGLVFTGIVLLIVRRLAGSRSTRAVLSGLALSVLGGIAPLLVPNPYLPDAVRWVHLGEVGVSNFLFGLFAGWLLGSAAAGEKVRVAPLAAAV